MAEEQQAEPTFEQELSRLLNRFSKDNGSNTPDFILARYLVSCLETFDKATSHREQWYGVRLVPARVDGPVQYITREVSDGHTDSPGQD